MMQTDGFHVMSRHQFLQKQAPEVQASFVDLAVERSAQTQVEESADALGAGSAAVLAATAGGSTEMPAVESAAIPDDASRTPFLPSDYVIDGDNENYLQDMDERVAADAAAQPHMVGHHSSGASSKGEGKINASSADGGDAEADTNSSGSSGDNSNGTGNGTSNGNGASAHSLDLGSGSDADVGTNSSGGLSADVLANASAAPIVSHINRSLENFGTGLHVQVPAENSSAASGNESSSLASGNESSGALPQEFAESPAEESVETPALESVDTPVEPPQAEVLAEGANHSEAQSEILGGANTSDDASRNPFLASDYVIDGDNENYLQDMDERVAADTAAQPAMSTSALS